MKKELTTIIIIAFLIGILIGYTIGIFTTLTWTVNEAVNFIDVDKEQLNLLINQYRTLGGSAKLKELGLIYGNESA